MNRSRPVRKKKENLKDRLLFKGEQEGLPLKRPNWNGSSLDSVLNGFLNFRTTSRGTVKSCEGQIIPLVISMFIKEKVLRYRFMYLNSSREKGTFIDSNKIPALVSQGNEGYLLASLQIPAV